MNVNLSDGHSVEVTSEPTKGGPGVLVSAKLMKDGEQILCTSTVTCYYNGRSYSASKECPSCSGNTGDCSDPQHPSVTCG